MPDKTEKDKMGLEQDGSQERQLSFPFAEETKASVRHVVDEEDNPFLAQPAERYPEVTDCPRCENEERKDTMIQGKCFNCLYRIDEVWNYFHRKPLDVVEETITEVSEQVPDFGPPPPHVLEEIPIVAYEKDADLTLVPDYERYEIPNPENKPLSEAEITERKRMVPPLRGIERTAGRLGLPRKLLSYTLPKYKQFRLKRYEGKSARKQREKEWETQQKPELRKMILDLLLEAYSWKAEQKERLQRALTITETNWKPPEEKPPEEQKLFLFKILSPLFPHSYFEFKNPLLQYVLHGIVPKPEDNNKDPKDVIASLLEPIIKERFDYEIGHMVETFGYETLLGICTYLLLLIDPKRLRGRRKKITSPPIEDIIRYQRGLMEKPVNEPEASSPPPPNPPSTEPLT